MISFFLRLIYVFEQVTNYWKLVQIGKFYKNFLSELKSKTVENL